MNKKRRSFIKNTGIAFTGLSVFPSLKSFKRSVPNKNFNLEIYATRWGYKGSMDSFCKKVKEVGYDGIEIWAPGNQDGKTELLNALKKYNLKLGLLVGNQGNSFEEHLSNFKNNLTTAISLNPQFINCHSGKDFFPEEQNAHFIEFANNQKQISVIPIYHETHRGRILFSAPKANHFMNAYADLRITLDISHWCCVHESLLSDQKTTIDKVLHRVDHIHSRVGFPEGPQIPNHDDPQYEDTVNAHFDWWDEVVRIKTEMGEKLTMTTEFGPPPYMWTSPYNGNPLADLWDVNVAMMTLWKNRYL